MKERTFAWFAFAGAILLSLQACSTPENTIEARILRIENGLNPESRAEKALLPGTSSLKKRMAFYRVPGVSIAVMDDFEIEWARAYGLSDSKSAVPLTTDTLFQAASISKPVTAVATLHLVEKGLISLDDDVNGKLASWKLPENILRIG